MSIANELSTFDDPASRRELLTIAGFLAGYGTATRTSYATDLRIYAQWCSEFGLRLFQVQRSHLELFARSMEPRGLMASTVARRLSTLASFYRYCQQEGHVDRSPAAHVRRPKVDGESRTLGLDRTKLECLHGPSRGREPTRPTRLASLTRLERPPGLRGTQR